jgi:hypothetical protein
MKGIKNTEDIRMVLRKENIESRPVVEAHSYAACLKHGPFYGPMDIK